MAKTWNVGVNQTYKVPSAVSNLVKDFDTVLIDAGVYKQDVALWKAHHLVIKSVGGKAHLKAEGKAYGQKAIWVIQGDSTIVDGIEFSECSVPDKNGAGIRLEATHLVVRNCYFHNNEDGILAGDNINSNVIIEYSEFAGNGFGDGLSHNLYINHVNSLIFRFNYSHDAKVGHLLKTRAYNNYIYYNRLTGEKGDGSYEIDLPNGGYANVTGNIIEQGPNSQNGSFISYGKEGLTNPTNHYLVLIHNTIVNNRNNGTFINMQNGTASLYMLNNIFAGPGTLSAGTSTYTFDKGNLRLNAISDVKFVDASNYDFHLLANSPAIDQGFLDTTLLSYLWPYYENYANTKVTKRYQDNIRDIGAYEYNKPLKFATPLKGNYGNDFIIAAYVDWKDSGFYDRYCNSNSYDGHMGTDFAISGFEQMDKGVDVLAADDGIVTAIVQDKFDKETTGDTSLHFGNYICIRHYGIYYTYYAHLKKNSVKVRPGDIVKKGDKIAEVGASGDVYDPHLHFELIYDSLFVIDPFSGPCGNATSLWENELPYDSLFHIWKSGVIPGIASTDSLRFHQYSKNTFVLSKDSLISYWNLQYGLRKGDQVSLTWYKQNNIPAFTFNYTYTADNWYNYFYTYMPTKTLGECSACRAEYWRNGQLVETIPFSLVKPSSSTTLDKQSPCVISENQIINTSDEQIEMEVFTTAGAEVYKQKVEAFQKVDLSFLPKGLYFIVPRHGADQWSALKFVRI